MKADIRILDILIAVSRNSQSRGDINKLIEVTYSIAYSYLKYHYKNLTHLSLTEDSTLKELAIDAIAPLFERDAEGLFIKLSKSFNEWDPKIESEEKALFFLNRVAAKSADKYVAELLRQSDPFFSKILDSVNYLTDKLNYKKKQLLGTTYIIRGEGSIDLSRLPDSTFISGLPYSLFKDKSRMLPEVFDFLEKKSGKAAAIPLNALIIKIKSIRGTNFLLPMHSAADTAEIESLADKALNKTISRMEESYLKKHKIGKQEFDGISKALERITFDLLNGGIAYGLHNYVLEQMEGISSEEYCAKYQNIFEYLYKILKEEIASQLKE